MRDQSASSLLKVAVVSTLCISVCRSAVSEGPWPGCDSGKLFLDKDLPEDPLYGHCPESESTQRLRDSPQNQHSVDTEHKPEFPVETLCMNESISYDRPIPSSGAYRPVGAEGGEYLFCPPQRWLNNLHHGATVILHHPCVSLHERHLLSVLAESCLSDYIITAHPWLKPDLPIAVVTWGHTLEVSTVASLDFCDWLRSTTTTMKDLSDVRNIRGYNLLLTKPAKPQTPKTKVSLRQCCQTIFSELHDAKETNLESRERKERLKPKEGKPRVRGMRAAARKEQTSVKRVEEGHYKKHTSASSDGIKPGGTNKGHRNSNSIGKSDISPPEQRNLPNPSNSPGGQSKSIIRNQNQSLTAQTNTYLVPNVSTLQHESNDPKQTEGKSTNTAASLEGIPAAVKTVTSVAPRSTDEGPKDRNSNNPLTLEDEKKDIEMVDVKERELEMKQKDNPRNPKSENISTESQNPRSATYQKTSGDCDNCREGEPCFCTPAPGADAAGRQDLPRTPRTDEAVWAAAALGFLLVLLTLSVLHTRLYRNWRTAPSLYWHNPQQDYDSVADVIHRRLKITKRRHKRVRRKEYVLQPSSSSSDEFP